VLSADREDFEKQLEVLFGGYPTFLTPPRKEAYWRGLQKMPLSMFIRCVDYALQDTSEEGKKLPTVHRLWDISHGLKSRVQPQLVREPENGPKLDHFARFANIQLFKFMRAYDVQASHLPVLLRRRNEIVEAVRTDPDMQPGGDEAEQGKRFHEILFAAWRNAIPHASGDAAA
jgi:hypothetical protein